MVATSSTISYLQQITFGQIASATALLYDYLLLLGSEVDLIWARKWNLVTLLYAIVRYLSFFLVLNNIFYFGNERWSAYVSLAWYQIRMWGPYVFRVAMDTIMMKRIYALSQRPNRFLSSPKWVLVTMVVAFIAKTAVSVTFLLLAIGPSSHLVALEHTVPGTRWRVCGTLIPRSTILISAQFPTLAFEVLLFVLAFTYFVADVWGAWSSKRSNMWKVNDLVEILVRDSTIYFAIIVVATVLDMGNFKVSGPTIYASISLALQTFLPFCFAPRLVINVKEHKNRVHMSELGGGLSEMVFAEGNPPQPEGTQQMEEFA